MCENFWFNMIFRVVVVCSVIYGYNIILAEESSEIPSPNMSLAITDNLKNGVEWIGDGISNVVESIAPTSAGVDLFEGRTICRKRKKHKKHGKFLVPMLVGFLLIKSILLPIALKGLAVLSGKAIVLSLMSLILAAIVGLRAIAQGIGPTGFSYDGYSKHRRKDQLLDDRNQLEDDDPYKYYREHRRRR